MDEARDGEPAASEKSGAVNGTAVARPPKRSRWDSSLKAEDLDDRGEKRKREEISTGGTGQQSGYAVGTNGTTPAEGKPESAHNAVASEAGSKARGFSLDALAKAKKALQMQKELQEKLKRLPQLNKAVQTAGVTPPKPALMTTPPTTAVPPPPASAIPTQATAGAVAPGTTPGMAATFPNLFQGLYPGMTFMPGFLPGMPPNLEAMRQMAITLGLQPGPPGTIPFLPGQFGQPSSEVGGAPKKTPQLRVDAQGRLVDEEGNEVEEPKLGPVSTLKVNINKQKKEAFKLLPLEEEDEDSPYFDPRMATDKKKLLRPKRGAIQFVEEGRWSKQAEHERLRAQFGEARVREERAKQAAVAKLKESEGVNPNLIAVAERPLPAQEQKKPLPPIPDVEWWDVGLLANGKYENVTGENVQLKSTKLTLYVEHPVPIEPPAEAPPPPPQPLKLTKKEQKKLRTQRRLAREKERQEMIRQGLLEPPKAKVKMSNLMRVLGTQAVQDPTKMEREVRSAAIEREQAHADRNLARKLTPAEKREKKERRLFDDKVTATIETVVSVYRVGSLAHPQTRFKVDINAQENHLSGCIAMSDSMTVIIVEGGVKAIKRYAKLMLRRINWEAAVPQDSADEPMDLEQSPKNGCVLVWQGSVAKPAFEKFSIQQCRTEAAARNFLAEHEVGHYWDLASNFPTD